MIAKRLLYFRLTLPLARLASKYHEEDDVWAKIPIRPIAGLFGPGCTEELKWYFNGDSSVQTKSVAQICRWLRGCSYVSDEDLFQRDDFWQHPCTFEEVRRGDCEDHALWAWRKLLDLGLEPEFVVGECKEGWPLPVGMHAWIRFDFRGRDYILESVSKDRARMLLPFKLFRDTYTPHFSVDSELRTHMYGGFIHHLITRDHKGKRPRVSASVPIPS